MQNLWMMDFVGRTFCDWVRTEIKEEGFACKLEEALEQGVPSYEFARILLEETGYATEAEQQAAMEIFRQLEEKDELSRHKLRADRLLRVENIIAPWRNIVGSYRIRQKRHRRRS